MMAVGRSLRMMQTGLRISVPVRKSALPVAFTAMIVAADAAASFDRGMAQRECSQQWPSVSILRESCIADLRRQFDMLIEYKAGLDPVRVTSEERRGCEERYPERYLDQRSCLEDAGACHYRDFHGKHPIEDYCP